LNCRAIQASNQDAEEMFQANYRRFRRRRAAVEIGPRAGPERMPNDTCKKDAPCRRPANEPQWRARRGSPT